VHRQALIIGWHVRNLHYVEKLKPIGHYLKPAEAPAEKRDQGARAVKAMFQRFAKKGTGDGSR
jgi:hypothetical protein